MRIKQNPPDVFVVDGDDVRAPDFSVSALDGKFVVNMASPLGRAISLLQSGDYDLVVIDPLASAIMRGYGHVLHNWTFDNDNSTQPELSCRGYVNN